MTRVEELRRAVLQAHRDYLIFEDLLDRRFRCVGHVRVFVALERGKDAARSACDLALERLGDLEALTDEARDPTVAHPTQS